VERERGVFSCSLWWHDWRHVKSSDNNDNSDSNGNKQRPDRSLQSIDGDDAKQGARSKERTNR